MWTSLTLAWIWLVDPYGVSPISTWQRVGASKPKRIDIDRLLKPHEVLRHQPKTVFLGTPRIHQSMDPASLDGTGYAPAYNAAIPASMLGLTVAQLEHYLDVDPNLQHVFVELFLYSFIYPQLVEPTIGMGRVIADAVALHFSSTALTDAVQTAYFNLRRLPPRAQVAAGGNYVYAPGHNPRFAFGAQSFSESIVAVHRNIADMTIQPTAIDALERIIGVARSRGVTLHLVITPSYPWDDYRLLSLGYWRLVEDFYRKMSRYEGVVSFAQYNEITEEAPADGMRYWNDPLHFSLRTGRLMLQAMSGRPDAETPANFMRRLDPGTVETVLAERRHGLEAWVARNPDFAAAFEKAKRAAGMPGS
jgi:hypothetical protein